MKPKDVIKMVMDNNSTISLVDGKYLTKIEKSVDKVKADHNIEIERKTIEDMRNQAIFMCGDNANCFIEHKNDKLFPNTFRLDPAVEKENRQKVLEEA